MGDFMNQETIEKSFNEMQVDGCVSLAEWQYRFRDELPLSCDVYHRQDSNLPEIVKDFFKKRIGAMRVIYKGN